MSNPFQTILDSLDTPDAQNRDWYAWATNQMSHALLGVAVALLFPVYALQVTFLIAALKEIGDVIRVPTWATAKDSCIDVTFWMLGALLIVFGHAPLIGISLITCGLVIGIFPRLHKALTAPPV